VESSRTCPTNWRMMPMFPDRPITPSSGVRSPAMMRKSVVLPVPLGPISAVLVPAGTLKVTPFSNWVPSERK
jgi:hypothetical protein